MAAANASTATIPNVSIRDGIATTRAPASSRAFSSPRTQPTNLTRSVQAQPRHLAAHAGLVVPLTGDHELPVDPVRDPPPRVEQQVEALAAELQPADVDDVAPGLLRLVEQRAVDAVADHLDLAASG